MKKYLQVQDEDNFEVYVVGILAHIPIYKLCWEINQVLKLNMIRVVLDIDQEGFTERKSRLQASLFNMEDLGTFQQEEAFYEDTSTEKFAEYRLFKNSQINKKIVTFPYIFEAIIHPPFFLEIDSLINTLKEIESVLSVKNISSSFS